MKEEGTTQYYLYANFDTHRIGLYENKIGRKVGEYALPKAEIGKVLVYAIFDLTENGLWAARHCFGDICSRNDNSRFHEKLNGVVEDLIKLTDDEDRCLRLRKQEAARKAYEEARKSYELVLQGRRLLRAMGVSDEKFEF